MRIPAITVGVLGLALAACSAEPAPGDGEAVNVAETAVAIPDSLAPFGDGYPNSGDPCRRLGESAATSNYLDDSAMLVGCPTAADASALGGTAVDTVEGVTLVSVPMGDANAGMAVESEDALVPGTKYHATTDIACGFDNAAPTSTCPAGVVREWGEDGTTLVEITKPDGRQRAIFFRGTTPYGADSAQADGSAAWDIDVSRNEDRDESVIKFGPETYVIVDAFIVGG